MILAVAWAVYLIPKALKHHDEVARTRSVDRFSTAMRGPYSGAKRPHFGVREGLTRRRY